MPYIPPSVVQEVKRMDLLTYLKNYEPYELVHFLIIPGLFEPPVRTLRATIPENESHIFR